MVSEVPWARPVQNSVTINDENGRYIAQFQPKIGSMCQLKQAQEASRKGSKWF